MDKNIIDVKVVSLIMDEKRDSAEGVVKVNGQDKMVRVENEYVSEKGDYAPAVYIKGMSQETLDTMGAELNNTSVIELFSKLLKEKKDEEKKEKVVKMEKFWDACPIHEIRKAIPDFVYCLSKQNWIDSSSSRDIELEYKQQYKGVDIRVSIQYSAYYSGTFSRCFEGYRFELENGNKTYGDRSRTKRIKKVDSAIKALKEMIEETKCSVDRNIERAKEIKKSFEKIQKEFSEQVYQSFCYSSTYKKPFSCCSTKTESKEHGYKGIDFTEGSKNEYTVKKLYGIFTAEQIKRIIAIADEGKFSY